MCGFITQFSNRTNGIMSEETKAYLAHRGPDDANTFVDDNVIMHFRRLSIMDPSEAGRQPMTSLDGRYVMTFNGEIYNFRELKSAYGLSDLRSQSDSEVLLELYSKIGTKIFDLIRGMYAFVIFDRKDKTFLAARDTFGIKPLYYMNIPNGIVFSSEIKPLLSMKSSVELNDAASVRFLLRGEMDDQQETFYKDVYQVSPGCYMQGSAQKNVVQQAQRFKVFQAQETDLESCIQKYDDLLVSTIKKYLYSDVPVGVSLSGGFDSSLLAYLIHTAAEGQPLHMFCRGYEGYEGNEFEAACVIGQKFGFKFHEAVLSPKEVPSLLIESARIQEHPVTSISILAFHKKYQEAKATGLKVLLEGHGGDEIWSGYAYYRNSLNKNSDLGKKLSHDGSHFGINGEIVRGEYLNCDLGQSFADEYADDQMSLLQGMQVADMFGGKMQRSLRYVDRASMNEGIEVRVPFLDLDIAQTAVSLPDSWKIKDEHHRYFIRNLAAKYLGQDVAFRQKVAIQDPQRLWLQTSLKSYVHDVLHDSNSFIKKYVSTDKLTYHFERFCKNPDEYKNLTFLVFPLCLEAWHKGMNDFLTRSSTQEEVLTGL